MGIPMRHKPLFTSALFLALLQASSLFSFCPLNYCDIYVAPTTNKFNFDISYTELDPRPEVSYKLSNLNGIKAGVRGQFFIGERLYIKGYADYGWITSGNFQSNDEYQTLTYKGSANGNVADGSIAFGYNFYPIKCFQIGPTLGWSYEKILTWTKNLQRNELDVQEQRVKSQLMGPYLGFEAFYAFSSNWTLLAGYECHLAVSKMKINDPIAETKCKLRNMIGNYVHLGVNAAFCSCWNAGVDLVGYSYNSYRKGSVVPNDVDVFTNREYKNVTVNTVEVRFFIGFQY